MRQTLFALLFALSCLPTAQAAEAAKPTGTLIDLTAEASRTATNDLARATLYAETNDAQQAGVAKKVNESIAHALNVCRSYPAVKAQSGSSHTWAASDKNGKITGWRMRSEVQLESRDMAALSELLGKLQSGLAVSQVNLQPAPDTRKKAEDGAMLDAITAFQARAKLVADHLHKPWRIRQMAVNTSGGRPPYLPMMARAAVADSAPMPLEAGDTQITVNVTGQIELGE